MNNSNMPFKKRENPLSKRDNPLNTGPINKSVTTDRDKYTATMEKELRKRVKIASAMKGIQLSTFIEEACMEKLDKEGF